VRCNLLDSPTTIRWLGSAHDAGLLRNPNADTPSRGQLINAWAQVNAGDMCESLRCNSAARCDRNDATMTGQRRLRVAISAHIE